MKQVLILLLTVFTLTSCKDLGSHTTIEDREAPTFNQQPVSFNLSMPSFQQQLLPNNESSKTERSSQNFDSSQIMTGELVVTNKITQVTENHNWTIYLNQDDFSIQSNKTIVLDAVEHEFKLSLTRGDQQYIGHLPSFHIVDGTNDVPMIIRPVIGDIITDISQLEKEGMIQFQYGKEELSKITTPKLGVSIDGGAEVIFAIDPLTGLVNNYFNLNEGQHKIELKLYDGDTQVGKSNPAQETVNVVAGYNLVMDLIPLEGEATFILTESGGSAKFRLNIPWSVINEVGGEGNLGAHLSIVSPKNPLREMDLPIQTWVNGRQRGWFVETTLDNYHYDTVAYTLTFMDKRTTPRTELGKCVQESVWLNQSGTTNLCNLTIKRASIATGNLYATLGINVFNTHNEPIAGAKIKINDQLVGITGSGVFGTPGYLKYRLKKGTYNIKAEDMVIEETNITIDSLDIKNLDFVLLQRPRR